MRNLSGLAALFVLFLSPGCFWKKAPAVDHSPILSLSGTNEPVAGDKFIITPAEGLNGKVSAVNSSLGFVVLTFPIGQMANTNQHLNVYRSGLKVGELNVTGPQRDDSIVADIVAGEVQTSDEVRDH